MRRLASIVLNELQGTICGWRSAGESGSSFASDPDLRLNTFDWDGNQSIGNGMKNLVTE
jgi:hypothetical protein